MITFRRCTQQVPRRAYPRSIASGRDFENRGGAGISVRVANPPYLRHLPLGAAVGLANEV